VRQLSRFRLWFLLIPVALAGLIYLPSLKYSFVSDDDWLIIYNRDLDASSPLPFFAQNFNHYVAVQGWTPLLYYRPLVMTSYWLDRHVWGRSPAGFHLTNVLLAALAALAVALVLARLFSGFWPVLIGGLAFALHPMHVESAGWIAGRTDILMVLFLALAFFGLIRWRRRPDPWGAILTLVGFGLALLCKETAVLFPLLALFYLDPFAPGRRKALTPSPSPTGRGGRVWALLAGMAGILLAYLLARYLVLSPLGKGQSWGGVTAGQRVLLVINALGRSTFNALVPFFHRLRFSNLAACARLGWPSLAGVAALVGAIWLTMANRGQAIGFGAATFLFFLLPSCDLFPLGSSWIQDRFVYLPVAGLIVIALALVEHVKTPRFRRALAGLSIIYLFALAWGTRAWLPVWKDNVALRTAMVREDPLDAACQAGLGWARRDAGDRSGAIQALRRAIELDSLTPGYHFDLSSLLEASGDTTGALRQLLRTTELAPQNPSVWSKLGDVLVDAGLLRTAVAPYRQTVRLDPTSATHCKLATVLEQVGDTTGASEEYQAALDLDPNNPTANNNLGAIILSHNQPDSAVVLLHRATAAQPDLAPAHYNLALAFRLLAQHDQALNEFRVASSLEAITPPVPDTTRRAVP
jgi:Flp pilus assembly protein TadD